MTARRTLALAAVVAGLTAGCGGGGDSRDGNPGAGGQTASPEARRFADVCGNCHTFAPAGSKGSVGPPLDGTRLDAAAIAAQIENGGAGMPRNLVQGGERKRLAQWIADNAGR